MESSGAPLSVHTAYKSEVSLSRPCSPLTNEASGRSTPVSMVQPSTIVTRPPIPNRCSSLERPVGPSIKEKSVHLNKHSSVISTGWFNVFPFISYLFIFWSIFIIVLLASFLGLFFMNKLIYLKKLTEELSILPRLYSLE